MKHFSTRIYHNNIPALTQRQSFIVDRSIRAFPQAEFICVLLWLVKFPAHLQGAEAAFRVLHVQLSLVLIRHIIKLVKNGREQTRRANCSNTLNSPIP